MPRFFVAGTNLAGGMVYIRGRDADHIRVLRIRPGEMVTVCDGDGSDYECRLVNSEKGEAQLEIVRKKECDTEPSIEVTLLCGLPKGNDRTDYILQKAVECGVTNIGFFQSNRCVAKLEDPQMIVERWQRIAEEAAKQSGRGIIPEVAWAGDYVNALNEAIHTDLPLMMYETGERVPLNEALKKSREVKTACIITGPEGGFESYEADMARKLGIQVCSMGNRILRCETAPIVALTALMYESGNLS